MHGRRLLLPTLLLALAAAGVGWWLASRAAVPPAPAATLEPLGDATSTVEHPAGAGSLAEEQASAAAGEAARDAADGAPAGLAAGDVDEFTASGLREPPEDPRQRTALDGRTVAPDGQPLAGVRVLASLRETAAAALDAPANRGLVREATSGADGRFALEGLDPGVVRLAFRAAGCAPQDAVERSLAAGERTDGGDFELARGVVLAGTVLDLDGVPVPGAALARPATPLLGPVHKLGIHAAAPLCASDSAGRFEIAGVAPGRCALLVAAEGFPEQRFEVDVPPERARVEGVELRLEGGAEIGGHLFEFDPAEMRGLCVLAAPLDGLDMFHGEGSDAWLRAVASGAAGAPPGQGNRPLGASRLWLAGVQRASVDEQGRFLLRGLSPGRTYALTVLPAARATDAECERPDPWAPPQLVPAGERDVELVYLPGARLEFEAVDAATGAPVERLRARLSGAWPAEPLAPAADGASGSSSARPGAPLTFFPGGVVVLADVRVAELDHPLELGDFLPDSGTVTLVIEAPGYDVLELRGLRLEPRRRTDLGLLRLYPLPLVELRVVAAADGRPVAGARVELFSPTPVRGRGRSAGTSDARGSVRLTSLATGVANLRVSCPGFAERQMPAPRELRPGAPPVDVELFAPARVIARVHDHRGAPAGAVTVALVRPQSDGIPRWARAAFTDSAGLAEFRDVPEGLFDVAAVARGGAPVQPGSVAIPPGQQLSVRNGATHEVELEILGFSTLSGTLWIGRDPLAHARIHVEAGARGVWRLGEDLGTFTALPVFSADARGAFRDVELLPGDYTLLIEHSGLGVRTARTVRVERGPTEVLIDVDDTSISGRVVDARGAPAADVLVQLFADRPGRRQDIRPELGEFLVPWEDGRRPLAETRTDAHGEYRLRCVPPGVPLEMFFARGRLTASKPRVHAVQGRALEGVHATLPDAGGLSIVLAAPLAPSGQHYGVRIVAWDRPEGLALLGQAFDGAGRAHFDELAAGRWVVMVCALDQADRIVERREQQVVAVKPAQITEFQVGW